MADEAVKPFIGQLDSILWTGCAVLVKGCGRRAILSLLKPEPPTAY